MSIIESLSSAGERLDGRDLPPGLQSPPKRQPAIFFRDESRTEAGAESQAWADTLEYTRAPQTNDQMAGILRSTFAALLRRNSRDLTARQLAVFLTCYLREGNHTWQELASELNVLRSTITRVFDRLDAAGLTRRVADPADGRRVVVQRTRKGMEFLAELHAIMHAAAADLNVISEDPASSFRSAPVAQGHDL